MKKKNALSFSLTLLLQGHHLDSSQLYGLSCSARSLDRPLRFSNEKFGQVSEDSGYELNGAKTIRHAPLFSDNGSRLSPQYSALNQRSSDHDISKASIISCRSLHPARILLVQLQYLRAHLFLKKNCIIKVYYYMRKRPILQANCLSN